MVKFVYVATRERKYELTIITVHQTFIWGQINTNKEFGLLCLIASDFSDNSS